MESQRARGTRRHHGTSTIFELFASDWQRLCGDPAVHRELADAYEAAGGARSLPELLGYVRSAGHADADRVLLALVARAVEGDRLAAVVTLHLLLPGTRRLAQRWWGLGDDEEAAAAAVAAVYQRICNYPLARRPGRVAANVLMDAAGDLRRSIPRLVTSASGTVTDMVAHLGDDDRRTPAEELLEILVDAVGDGRVRVVDAELIARSRIFGESVEAIASERDVRPRTLWYHRQVAERALRVGPEPTPRPS